MLKDSDFNLDHLTKDIVEEARTLKNDPEIVVVLLHGREGTICVTHQAEYGDGDGTEQMTEMVESMIRERLCAPHESVSLMKLRIPMALLLANGEKILMETKRTV